MIRWQGDCREQFVHQSESGQTLEGKTGLSLSILSTTDQLVGPRGESDLQLLISPVLARVVALSALGELAALGGGVPEPTVARQVGIGPLQIEQPRFRLWTIGATRMAHFGGKPAAGLGSSIFEWESRG